MQKITPFLWYDGNAEEAVNLYTSLFPDSKITSVARNPKGAPGPEGAVLVMGFELFGQRRAGLADGRTALIIVNTGHGSVQSLEIGMDVGEFRLCQ